MTSAEHESTKYRLDLMENGLDFVKTGIETYFISDTPDPRAHKYAILHIYAGLLLLMKERLARVYPSLVFEKVTDVGKRGARTTNYDETVKRLKAHGVEIEPVKRAMLDRIQGLRNEIEHYKIELSLPHAKAVISELTAFTYWFCADELQFGLEHRLSERVLTRFFELKQIGDLLYAEALQSANADAEADNVYFDSLRAKYAAMSTSALLALAAVDHGDPTSFRGLHCPACGESTLVLLEVAACVNPVCRTTHRFKECRYCQGVAFGGGDWCDGCKYGQV